jgi:hypothetical protein
VRSAMPVHGSGYLARFPGADQIDDLLGFRGAFTLRLHAISAGLFASLHLPGGRSMNILITNDADLMQRAECRAYREGKVYLVIPQLSRFIGPIPLPDYLADRMNVAKLPELSEIEHLRKADA